MAFCQPLHPHDSGPYLNTEDNTIAHSPDLSGCGSGKKPFESTTAEIEVIHHPIEAYDDLDSDTIHHSHKESGVGNFDTTTAVSLAQNNLQLQPTHQPVETILNSDSAEILQLVELPSLSYPPPDRVFFELFSGPHAPLTHQVLHFGVSCLQPMDILCDPSMDILDNACFEQLLRLASSRIIGSLSAAPPCKEYTLLKLAPGGPPPCRSPQHMDAPLVDVPACIDRFYSSREILYRTVQVLRVNFYHGGTSALEQPASAMSWNEEFVQEARNHFLLHTAEFSHCQFLEDDEKPYEKKWRFVASIAGFSKATKTCSCNDKHESFRGKRNANGQFISATTAEYPTRLAQHLCGFLLLPDLLVQNPSIISWQESLQHLLPHPPMRFSHIPDGASLVSSALWPIPYVPDRLKPLRNALHELIFRHRLDLKIRAHIEQRLETSPFDQDVKSQNIQIFQDFLQSCGFTPDLSIPEGQPFRLASFQQLATFIDDPDSTFIDELKVGVSLGTDSPIQPSGDLAT